MPRRAIGDCVLPIGCCPSGALRVRVKHTLRPRTSLAHAPLTHMNSRTKKTLFPPQPAPPRTRDTDTAPEDHTMMVKSHSAPLACRTMMRPDACGPPHEARADARQKTRPSSSTTLSSNYRGHRDSCPYAASLRRYQAAGSTAVSRSPHNARGSRHMIPAKASQRLTVRSIV